MKLRKHKNNKRFVVTFQTSYRSAGGKLRLHPKTEYTGVSDSKGGFLRGFYFGIDRYNTQIFSVVEKPV